MCACIRRTVVVVHFQQGIETLSLISSSHNQFRHSIVVICESSNTSSSPDIIALFTALISGSSKGVS